VGGDLCMSWHKGEHGSGKVMAVVVRPLLKPTEDGRGLSDARSMGEGYRWIGRMAEQWSRGSGRPKGNGVWARGPVWANWRGSVRENSDIL
jgi:hypothetical protein